MEDEFEFDQEQVMEIWNHQMNPEEDLPPEETGPEPEIPQFFINREKRIEDEELREEPHYTLPVYVASQS